MALILPVIALVSMIAINLATMQLMRTELKIATDSAARAGGRAWSEFQDTDSARSFAIQAAAANTVGGEPLILDGSEESGQIEFGRSARATENGRYVFSPSSDTDPRALTGIRVNASTTNQLAFAIGLSETFSPAASSVASQVDRDIALVVDRSGSMAYYKDEDFLFDTVTALYQDPANNITESEYEDAISDYQARPQSEARSLAQRHYSDSVINAFSGDLREYAITFNRDYRHIAAPQQSRWSVLEEANAAFFEVLRETDQEEIVSVTSFSNTARIEIALTSDMDLAEQQINGIIPHGSTAIGKGALEAMETLLSMSARPEAVPTIVVFSDGQNKQGISPSNAAQRIKNMKSRCCDRHGHLCRW